MNPNPKSHSVEIPIGGRGGLVWNRFHSEREDICEALITDSRMGFGAVLQSSSEVVLERMCSFDTILVRTLNTDYRILLLEPKIGRVLVEGGQYFVEPREAWLTGSRLSDSSFKLGSITVGYHLEMWVDNKMVRTSRVQSISVEHTESAESIEAITEAIH